MELMFLSPATTVWGRPGPEVTGASSNRGQISAAIKAVLTRFRVNECLATTFNLKSVHYCAYRRAANFLHSYPHLLA